MRHLLGVLSFAILLALASAVGANPAGDSRARALADQLESPFCPGRTLSSCTSPAAAKWRVEIDGWVNDGVPSEEIRRRLSERAGRDLRVVPKSRSFYGLLALSGLLSLGAIGMVIRALRPRDEELASDASETPLDAQEELQADAELDQLLDYELDLVE